ncbi:MAG: Fe(3+) ABC transporter substrate-binding protein [Pseudomonadota bacterium]
MQTPILLRRCRAAALTLAGAAVLTAPVVSATTALANDELNIYSYRQEFLLKPLLKAYEAETGTKFNVVFAPKGLAQRLEAEGAQTPADLVLTVDIARLSDLAEKDLLAPVASEVLTSVVPGKLRDPQNRWFALSKRARILAVSKKAKDIDQLKTYADLADARWKGRICSRPGSHVYNRALIASIIDAEGAEKAQAWAEGVVANFARRPQGNDRAQVKAIYEGVCDVAIINNYYIGKLQTSDKPEQPKWAEAVTLVFPNQDGRGTHVNVSGAGVVKHSKRKEAATRFLEFLVSPKAQAIYAETNFEYPVNAEVEPPPALKAQMEKYREDALQVSKIADLAPEAQKLIDRVGW